MEKIIITTPDGKFSLLHLVDEIGVERRVEYFNIIEKKAPKKERTLQKRTVSVPATHDYGLVFFNGLQIRHVSKNIFKYFDEVEVIRIRERNPNYVPKF